MNTIENLWESSSLIRRALKNGWSVDATDYILNRGLRRIAIRLKSDSKYALVYHTPGEKTFFGILIDGTQFHSSDKKFRGLAWFDKLVLFFRGPVKMKYRHKNPILDDLPKRISLGELLLYGASLVVFLIVAIIMAEVFYRSFI